MIFSKRKTRSCSGNAEEMSNKRMKLHNQQDSLWESALDAKSIIASTSKEQVQNTIANTIPEHIDKLCEYGLIRATSPPLQSQLHNESLILSQVCCVLKLFINIRISEIRTTTATATGQPSKSTVDVLVSVVGDIRTVHSSAHGLLSLLGDSRDNPTRTTTIATTTSGDDGENKNIEIAIELLCLYLALLDRLLEIKDILFL